MSYDWILRMLNLEDKDTELEEKGLEQHWYTSRMVGKLGKSDSSHGNEGEVPRIAMAGGGRRN